MKIAVFVGSLRKQSLNRKLFEVYASCNGIQDICEEVDFSQFPIYNADLHESGEFPPGVLEAGELVKGSAAVLFVLPEYNYSVPGGLKNGLDWISRLRPQPFAAKPAGIIGGSPGRLGASRAQYHLRQVGVFLDLRWMNQPEVMIAHLGDVLGQEPQDSKLEGLLKGHWQGFKTMILGGTDS